MFVKCALDWLNELIPAWEGCGPWVPESELTDEGRAIRTAFLAMLGWDRRAIPHLRRIADELELRP